LAVTFEFFGVREFSFAEETDVSLGHGTQKLFVLHFIVLIGVVLLFWSGRGRLDRLR
jgi:hypothetical protein